MHRRGLSGSRTAALVCAAALSLHELRYLLTYGAGSSRALSQQSHDYLDLVTPFVVIALAVVAGRFLTLLALPRGKPQQAIGWFSASAALLAIYCCQESLEGLLTSGHPGGLEALTEGGGWLALPLAVVLGGVVSLLLRGANAALGSPAAVSLRRGALSRERPPAVLSSRRATPAPRSWSSALGARGPPGCLL